MTARSIFGLVAVVFVLALCSAALAGEGTTPETVTITGVVSVEKNAEGAISSAKITVKAEGKDDVVYNVSLRRGKGKEMAEKLEGKKVEATGTIRTREEVKTITVNSYKAVEEEKPAEPKKEG